MNLKVSIKINAWQLFRFLTKRKKNLLTLFLMALQKFSSIYRLTGSFVPDLIVSMSNQMWLHLQTDESVGSIGFKVNYKGNDILGSKCNDVPKTRPILWNVFLSY